MRLTQTFVNRSNDPGRYGDGRGGFGLSLLVKPRAGGGFSKTFSQRLRVQGRVVSIGLGAHPLYTLAEVREMCIDNARVAVRGGDPRRQESKTPTFAEAVELVIAKESASWKGGANELGWRTTLRDYALPRLGGRRVDDIDTQDVHGVLKPIWSTKRPTARKVLRRVGAIMTWAVAQGYRTDDPTTAVKALLPANGHKTEHRPALHHGDLGAVLTTIRESSAWLGARLAVEFVALTATRSGEVRGARWNEIDLEAATWTIPASRTKTQQEHTVPLSTRAVEVLRQAQGLNASAGMVFPSARGVILSNMSLSRVWTASSPGGTVHGLRSSFRDWAAETGVDRALAESALGHVVGGVEGAYLRSSMIERRRPVMEAWAAHVG